MVQAAIDSMRAWQAQIDKAHQSVVGAFAPGARPPGDRDARIRAVIDRAKSQLGVPYAWGGGNKNGPTRGIRDGGVADAHGDYKKIGFDCSGLMEYAFAGSGAQVDGVSGHEATQGQRVPVDQVQPGDMVFYAGSNGEGKIHHVALYIGNGQMIEAPESGKTVRITAFRRDNTLVHQATRPIP